VSRLQAGIVPQCAVVHEINDIQIDPDQFQHGTHAALQLRLKGRQFHILPAFVDAALGPAALGAFLLDGLRLQLPILPFLTTHPCPEPQKSLMLIGEGIDIQKAFSIAFG
jgi:phage tail protein X